MAPEKSTKVLTKRRKFIDVDLPSTKSKISLIANNVKELENKTLKLDLTRQLKGKSVEAIFKIRIEDNKAIGYPIKIKLMPYFIRRMIRKRISYVEDSFSTPSQESMIVIKPFLITRKRVSKAVRKTLRNKCKNWLEDYVAERIDSEVFNDMMSNRLQKTLSLYLKKTYPLSLCEIRIIEIKRNLKPEEVPKIKEKPKIIEKKQEEETFIDQMEEIEQERLKKAQQEIKETQEIAEELEEGKITEQEAVKEIEDIENESEKDIEEKPKKSRKKKTEKKEE